MSLKDAERNLKGLGRTIAQNTPGPAQLAQGFRETARGIWVVWVFIAFLLLFGEPIVRWLAKPVQPCREMVATSRDCLPFGCKHTYVNERGEDTGECQ